jgi:hypothetical protein
MGLPDAAHRPWPLPRRPWVLAMQWHDLLFMYWLVPPVVLHALIPSALEPVTFEAAGATYIYTGEVVRGPGAFFCERAARRCLVPRAGKRAALRRGAIAG